MTMKVGRFMWTETPNQYISAFDWANKKGFGTIRLPVEEVLDEPDQVTVPVESVDSLEPPENLLGVEFVLETGRHYPTERAAAADAIAIYRELAADDAAWELPEKWGFWFQHNGPFNFIWLSPENFEAKLAWTNGLPE